MNTCKKNDRIFALINMRKFSTLSMILAFFFFFRHDVLGGTTSVIRSKGFCSFGPLAKPYLMIETVVILNPVVSHRRLCLIN
jgi:hypothetical protein